MTGLQRIDALKGELMLARSKAEREDLKEMILNWVLATDFGQENEAAIHKAQSIEQAAEPREQETKSPESIKPTANSPEPPKPTVRDSPIVESPKPKVEVKEVPPISESEFVALMLDEDREVNEEFLKKPWRKVSEILAYFKKLDPDDDTSRGTIYNRHKAGDYVANTDASPILISTASVARSFGELR